MFYDEELDDLERDKAFEYEEESHTLNEAQQEAAELEWIEELRTRCYEKGRWEL